jgi:hypothetical protein
MKNIFFIVYITLSLIDVQASDTSSKVQAWKFRAVSLDNKIENELQSIEKTLSQLNFVIDKTSLKLSQQSINNYLKLISEAEREYMEIFNYISLKYDNGYVRCKNDNILAIYTILDKQPKSTQAIMDAKPINICGCSITQNKTYSLDKKILSQMSQAISKDFLIMSHKFIHARKKSKKVSFDESLATDPKNPNTTCFYKASSSSDKTFPCSITPEDGPKLIVTPVKAPFINKERPYKVHKAKCNRVAKLYDTFLDHKYSLKPEITTDLKSNIICHQDTNGRMIKGEKESKTKSLPLKEQLALAREEFKILEEIYTISEENEKKELQNCFLTRDKVKIFRDCMNKQEEIESLTTHQD